MTQTKETNIHVIHHADADGYADAVICSNTISEPGKNIKFYATNYGKEFPAEVGPEDEVYILDFSYKRDFLLNLKSKVKKLVVIDHHKSAEKELEGLDFAVFDLTKSGVLLAWEYFVPEYPATEPVILLDCYDLWKKDHELYSWDEIMALHFAVTGHLKDYAFWTSLINQWKVPEELKRKGGESLINFQNHVKDIKESPQTEIFEINDLKFCVFHTDIQISLTSDAIYTDPDLDVTGTICFDTKEDRVLVSVRSRDKEKFNARLFCEKHGGGGHDLAAGFYLEGFQGDEPELTSLANDFLSDFFA